MPNNRYVIEDKLKEIGYSLGCYNSKIERLTRKELNKVLGKIQEDWTDILVTINGSKYIVEIKTVDYEKDFDIVELNEYNERYGNK